LFSPREQVSPLFGRQLSPEITHGVMEVDARGNGERGMGVRSAGFSLSGSTRMASGWQTG
jgi:hypothetical protein